MIRVLQPAQRQDVQGPLLMVLLHLPDLDSEGNAAVDEGQACRERRLVDLALAEGHTHVLSVIIAPIRPPCR